MPSLATHATKVSRKNNFPCLGVDPSRLAALLVLSIEEYAQSSRLSRQVSQQPNRGSYSCTNPNTGAVTDPYRL